MCLERCFKFGIELTGREFARSFTGDDDDIEGRHQPGPGVSKNLTEPPLQTISIDGAGIYLSGYGEPDTALPAFAGSDHEEKML